MVTARRTGVNENISTYGDGTRDYTSLSVWESATDYDLVAGTTSEVLEIYNDAVFDDSVDIAGATTDVRYRRIVRAAPGHKHNNTPNSGVRFDITVDDDIFFVDEANFGLYDLVLSLSVNSATGRFAVRSTADSGGSVYVGLIIHSCTNAGAGIAEAFSTSGLTGSVTVVDCISINNSRDGFRCSNGTLRAYNCTAASNTLAGFERAGGTFIAINCLADGNPGSDFNGTFSGSSSNNASSDATAPGGDSRINQTFTFVNSGGDDYRLAVSDAGAKDFGLDLSTDSVYPFGDDIARNLIDVWDIGASEPEPLPPTARRRGLNEDISTYGVGRDFSSLGVWESATDNDLVTSETTEVLELYDDAVFDDSLSQSGGTYNNVFFRILRPASGQGHDGTPNTGVRFHTTTANQWANLAGQGISVQDLVIRVTRSSGGNVAGIIFAVSGGNSDAVGCIIHDVVNEGAGPSYGVLVSGPTIPVYLTECVIIRCGTIGVRYHSSNPLTVRNCVAIGNETGFQPTLLSYTVINCLASGNTTADFAGSFASDSITNASSDATAPGTAARINQTFDFTDADNDDYSLTLNDTGARGYGYNLRLDPIFPFADDLVGANWNDSWSIGASWIALSARRRAVNENISTYGVSRDYSSLATWEAATDNDLVTARQSEVLELYDDAVFDDSITIAGDVSDINFHRILRPAEGQGHNGTPNVGVRLSSSTGIRTIIINDFHVKIQDLVISITANSASNAFGLLADANSPGSQIIGCIAHTVTNVGAGAATGFGCSVTSIQDYDNGPPLFVDCLSINNDEDGFSNSSSGQAVFYNCTASGNGRYSYYQFAGTVLVKNCIGNGATTADFQGTFTSDSRNNASSDGTAPGTSSRVDQTFLFLSEPGLNFHLSPGDEGAKGFGFDLSTDLLFPFNDDIDFELFTGWDIGFDQSGPIPQALVELDLASCTSDIRVYKWLGISEIHQVEAVRINGGLPMSIMVEGEFGAGGVVGAEGSNVVGGNFYPLNTLATFSAAGIAPVEETALLVRPLISEGLGVEVDVYLLVRGGLT